MQGEVDTAEAGGEGGNAEQQVQPPVKVEGEASFLGHEVVGDPDGSHEGRVPRGEGVVVLPHGGPQLVWIVAQCPPLHPCWPASPFILIIYGEKIAEQAFALARQQ